jgi:hypothetical protein
MVEVDGDLRWSLGIGIVYRVDTSISVDETIVYDVIISIRICWLHRDKQG